MKRSPLVLAAAVTLLTLAAAGGQCWAVDFHVATAQDLQNALTTAAANGANNNIYLAAGYYLGNFNFNSSGGYNLTITNEVGVTNNTQVAIDGGGLGRDLNLSNTGIGSVTVQGMTFIRNCGTTTIGALRIAPGTGATILVQNCQFLSPTNTSGMGLEIDSGLNATITNCTVTGTSGGGGTGIAIPGVTGSVSIMSCTLDQNIDSYNVGINNGGAVSVPSAAVVNVVGNTFSGNSISVGSGAGYFTPSYNGGGIYCGGTATISGNTFIGNSASGPNGYTCIGVWGNGGSVYCAGSATIANNTFISNSLPEGCGAGVYCAGPATLMDNTFSGNSAGACSYGGAVYCGGTATLTGNLFNLNSATEGGGVYSVGATTLLNNDFSGNSVNGTAGGGAYCGGPTLVAVGNTFAGNVVSNGCPGYGGGIYCSSTTTLALSNNVFTGNSTILGGCGSGSYGGAVYCSSTSTNPMIISMNTFIQNTAMTGGGAYLTSPTLTFQDNLVVGNSQTGPSSQGGGLWVDATSVLYMINNTIFGNVAAGSGGGAAFEVTGTVELLNVYNNIIWGNSAAGNGADVWLAGTGQQKVFLYNDVNNMYGVWDIAQNILNVDPKFFNPVAGDYHLQSTSPCLNYGTNGAPSLPLTDLDGNARTNSGGQVDLGAYEFNTSATHPADTNAAFIITTNEFNAYSAAWKAGLAWTNAPASAPNPIPIPANYLTRAGYLLSNGGAYTNNGSARPTNWTPSSH